MLSVEVQVRYVNDRKDKNGHTKSRPNKLRRARFTTIDEAIAYLLACRGQKVEEKQLEELEKQLES